MRPMTSLLVASVLAAPAGVVAQETPLPDRVYAESVVDEIPERVSCPEPHYPTALRQAGVEGSVVVQFVIEPDGRVLRETVEILKSTHEGFEDAAAGMVVGCTFRPGRVRDTAVRVLVQMPLMFTLAAQVAPPGAARRDTLALRALFPDAGEIAPAMQLLADGPAPNPFAQTSGAAAIANWHQRWGAVSPPSTLGSTELIAIDLWVASFPTAAAARGPLDLLDMLDLSELARVVRGAGSDSAVRVVAADSVSDVGDRTLSWIVELRSEAARADTYAALVLRGRVLAWLTAVARPGRLDPVDLHPVLRLVDGRIARDSSLAEDLSTPRSAVADVRSPYMADSVLLERSGGIDLAAILPTTADVADADMTEDELSESGIVGWTRTFEGSGLVMRVGASRALMLSAEADLYESVEDAIREIATLEASGDNPEAALAEFMEEEGGDVVALLATMDLSLEPLPVETRGLATVGIVLRVRGAMNADIAVVAYVEGRIGVMFLVIGPADQLHGDDVVQLLRRSHERLQAVAPQEVGRTVAADVYSRMRRAAALRFVASGLARAREPLAAWDTVQAMRAIDPEMELDGGTFNLICWYGSLAGHAARVLPACEDAVAEDSTVASWRNSRGLARALTGDTAGAIADFQYYVDNAKGPGTGQRARWIEQLRQGVNPFTPELLQSLKEP